MSEVQGTYFDLLGEGFSCIQLDCADVISELPKPPTDNDSVANLRLPLS